MSNKKRIQKFINSHKPRLFPWLNINGKVMYFDKLKHPGMKIYYDVGSIDGSYSAEFVIKNPSKGLLDMLQLTHGK
ncbi:hypothetical protein I4P13_16260 [Elizabethkingia meningoseptica]|uniref:hypothetical protein n=1 Tax=Elizabethkingia meningoseptica TaxID=238 RepID=UPI0018C32EF3|nr:hypothetical protein [Elizabethkingia meningoseptica]MBG0515320.1 hypothetical protein [Elizabethkingia meningoseptica]